MKRLLTFLLMVAIVMALHCGCATTDISRQRHTQEMATLNNLVDEFTIEFKKADFSTQVQWRYRIVPQIRKAQFGLFSWDIALSVNELAIAKEKEQSFLMAKNKLISTLKGVKNEHN